MDINLDFSRPNDKLRVKSWSSSADAVRSWRFKTGMQGDRIAILNAAWDKELGHMSRHWRLSGIKKGILYIDPQSPAAAMELRVREKEITRTLNKYFKSGWIKGVKARGW